MFDVESTSLFGTGFAVGVIVISIKGIEIDRFELKSLEGESKANDWVKENVIPNLSDIPTCETDRELRDRFFEFLKKHRETCDIWSDCNFPVETNFLNQIVQDNPSTREWSMPYPLKDLCTILDVNVDREILSGLTSLRKHNPLDDAIASAYCLLKELMK